MKSLFTIALSLFAFSLSAAGTDPKLKIGAKTFSASELLKRRDIQSITVPHDPAYNGREMHYQAITAASLFAESNLRDNDFVQFRCLDGFVAAISKDRIMQTGSGKSTAYLAVENPASKWPDLPVKSNLGSAGPFYLVWLNPELSGILKEEWPYQIVAFDVRGSLAELFPQMFPARRGQPQIERGLKLFQQTCFACHTINHQGPSQVGPDLNLPLNPTEYLREEILPRYIRDPKSIRTWQESKMPGFGIETFSDEDIKAIIAYLKEMAAEKRTD